MNQDFDYIEANPDLIFYFDNVLDRSVLTSVVNFKWQELVPMRNKENGFIKTFDFYLDRGNPPSFLQSFKDRGVECFSSLDNNFTLKSIDKFHFSLSESDGTMTRQNMHPDAHKPGGNWTMLYHLDGEDGSTNFYNNKINKQVIKEVKFNPNRLIIFPAIYFHQGDLPIRGRRLVVNIRCQFNTKFNLEILKNSPILQKKYQQEYTEVW